MKRFLAVIIVVIGLGMAVFGQSSLALGFYRGLEQSGKDVPKIGAKTEYFEVYATPSGQISELRKALGRSLADPKTTFIVQYAENGCKFAYVDSLNHATTEVIEWTSSQEGLYAIKIHMEKILDPKTGKKNKNERQIALRYGKREAYWGVDEAKSSDTFRWRISKDVQQLGFDRGDPMLFGIQVLDGSGLYMPDTMESKSEYKKSGKETIGYSYYRYNWDGLVDSEGWMREDVWKYSGQGLSSPDVFITVLNYLILEEYFNINAIKYFGHSLFNIVLK